MTQNIPPYHRQLLLPALVLLLSACGGGGGGGGGGDGGGGSTPPVSFHIIASGGASNCRMDGSTHALACWGQNDMGQLGIGNTTNPTASPTSVNLGAGKSAKQVAIGMDHACAILNDDTVSCWGNNSVGQLGQPLATASSSSPLAVTGITAKALALGLEHTCVITLADSVRCWGGNSKGQLGQPVGALTQSHLPQAAITGLSAKVIQSGHNHVCAIALDNTVRCWGDNQFGQLGNTSNVDSEVPVRASNLTGAVVLGAAAYHSCASSAAAISCWGRNDAGQLGSNGTTDLNVPTQTATARASVSQLVAGRSHTCALSGTTLECWGSNANKQLSGLSAGGTGFVAVSLTNSPKSVSAGLNHTCAQDSGNKTYCWGAGSLGRLGPSVSVDSATPVLVP